LCSLVKLTIFALVSLNRSRTWYEYFASLYAAVAALLAPGDVLLIEQQAYANGTYCPVSVDPATWDAIRAAVDAGIVVVEPGGNGGADLDGPEWSGWFDRAHDSGSILVGGGASPSGGYEPLAWYPNGSSYGARVDVQGWFDGIVTTSGGDYPAFSDLFLPDGDLLQGYTASFGGTSGASPMVAAAAALLQSIAIRTGAGPYAPEELRALLRSTGTPQRGGAPIGPQPDLRRLLRTVALP
jgi:subtilisin family serine protease